MDIYIQSQELGEGALLRRICLMKIEPLKHFIYHPGFREVKELFLELPEDREKGDWLKIFGDPLELFPEGKYAHSVYLLNGNHYLVSFWKAIHWELEAIFLLYKTHVVGQRKNVLLDDDGKVVVIIDGEFKTIWPQSSITH